MSDYNSAISPIIDKCVVIASRFITWHATEMSKCPQLNSECDNIDELFEVGEDELQNLFAELKGAMNLPASLELDTQCRYFDSLHGTQSKHNNRICVGLCIGVEPATQILETLLHELFHSFQDAVMDDPAFSPIPAEIVKIWKYESENYVSSDKNNSRYQQQEIERSARQFASEVIRVATETSPQI